MQKNFPIHTLAASQDICNYFKERKLLNEEVRQGRRVLLLGRRNTGKTSLLHSVVIPEFRRLHPEGLVISIDFMSVLDMTSLKLRIEQGLTNGIRNSYPTKAKLTSIFELIKSLRPVMTVDGMTGNIELSIAPSGKNIAAHLDEVFNQIEALHKQKQVLMIFDEFQDIAFVPEATAILRGKLQHLSSTLPIIITGSKTHLLRNMFAAGKAPFASWGLPIELPRISAVDYHEYINERFAPRRIELSLELTAYLLDLFQGVPESVNIICLMLMDHVLPDGGVVTEKHINQAIDMAVERYHSIFSSMMIRVTAVEERILRTLARTGPVSQPRGKDFLRQVDGSPGGISAALRRLEDDGLVFRLDEGYVVNDPLLGEFLKRRR